MAQEIQAPTTQLLEKAAAALSAGNTKEAEALYQEVLSAASGTRAPPHSCLRSFSVALVSPFVYAP